MKALKLLLVGVAMSLSGCLMFSASDVTVSNLDKAPKGPKVVSFLSDSSYMPEFSVALAQHGFKIKGAPSQQQIIRTDGNTTSVFNEASTRWAVSVKTQGTGLLCAFTEFSVYNFTLTLTDIANNEVVMVLKQKGSDGPCTTIKPVFETLATALSENW